VQDPVAYRLETALAPCHHVDHAVSKRTPEGLDAPSPVLVAKTSKLFERKRTQTSSAAESDGIVNDDSNENRKALQGPFQTGHKNAPKFCAVCYGRRIPQFSSELPQGCSQNRLDYSLERHSHRLSWEYVSALAAHTCYYTDRDVINFVHGIITETSPGEVACVSPIAEYALSYAENAMSRRGKAAILPSNSPRDSPVSISKKESQQLATSETVQPRDNQNMAPSALDLLSSMVSSSGSESTSKQFAENYGAVGVAASARGHTTIARILAERKAKEKGT